MKVFLEVTNETDANDTFGLCGRREICVS